MRGYGRRLTQVGGGAIHPQWPPGRAGLVWEEHKSSCLGKACLLTVPQSPLPVLALHPLCLSHACITCLFAFSSHPAHVGSQPKL